MKEKLTPTERKIMDVIAGGGFLIPYKERADLFSPDGTLHSETRNKRAIEKLLLKGWIKLGEYNQDWGCKPWVEA